MFSLLTLSIQIDLVPVQIGGGRDLLYLNWRGNGPAADARKVWGSEYREHGTEYSTEYIVCTE